jgi:hypothetical protein
MALHLELPFMDGDHKHDKEKCATLPLVCRAQDEHLRFRGEVKRYQKRAFFLFSIHFTFK